MKQEENRYQELRSLALQTKPEQLGLTLPPSKTIVYGIVMDWDIQNGTASIIAFQTGDARVYFSSGGGIIGGSTHENVRVTALGFIEKAQQMIGKTIKTELTPLPENNKVIFYLLTNNGTFTGQDKMENFTNHTSIWLRLFLIGNEIINELRTTKEK